MGELREWWANLYMRPWGDCVTSLKSHATQEAAMNAAIGTPVVGRVHVRLKPEGAPKRYLNSAERMLWEQAPEWMRARASTVIYSFGDKGVSHG
jgi:hypothetical protein